MSPSAQTQAYLELPYLIATLGIREKYGYAIELLDKHRGRLMFPVQYFRWHAAHALIAADSNDVSTAKTHAQEALDAAGLDHTGFRYHPRIGLVTERYDNLLQKLKSLC